MPDSMPDSISIASPGMCLHNVPLSEPCMVCLRVSDINGGESGIPDDPNATVLVECSLCESMLEVRTGCVGIDDALSAGWEIVSDGDLVCTSCAEARADLIGDER